jgi:hypothetical protein
MSVTRVHKHSSRARRTKDGPELTETWLVICDDLTDGAEVALSADDGTKAVPSYGDTRTVLGKTIKARDITADPRDSKAGPVVFNVQVIFREDASSSETDSDIENPLLRPSKYSYPDDPVDEQFAVDVDGLPITNSAGVPPENLPTRRAGDGRIRIRRNVSSFDDVGAHTFRRKINNGIETIDGNSYGARTLLIQSWTADGPFIENGFTFYTEQIDIAKNADQWDLVYADQGRSELDDNGNRVAILDGDGNEVADDWPLDGAGAALANATDAATSITRKPYQAVNFPSF